MRKAHYDFNRPDHAIEARANELLARMSLPEKIMQMTQINVNFHGREVVETRLRQGAGSVLTIYGAAEINRLQRIAIEESRLGIPILLGNDVIHGYRTIFPIPLAWSCTWDPDLVEEAARIAAEEASSDGTNWIFAPVVDICRDARWGRIAEGAGEDPFLGRAMAAAQVRGFQSRLSNGRRLLACPKHFAAYGATEDGRDYNTVDISERTLRDVYLPPFKAAFDAGAGSVMSAFNEIAGVPCTGSTLLLQRILREEWDFCGIVVSDWESVGEMVEHGFAADLREAACLAALAGVDMDMAADAYHRHMEELVETGRLPVSLVDGAVRRILGLKIALGLFENPYVDEGAVELSVLQPASLEKALEVAQKSIVLLKNEGSLLPLDGAVLRQVALIGPLADDHHEILGTWYRIGRDEDTESVLQGLEAVLPQAHIHYVPGCSLTGEEAPDFTPALDAAREADATILVLGEGEAMSGEAHSRAHLGLPGHQQALLEAVHATGKPLVVVLMSGRPLAVPWLAEHVPAILQAWHGGLRAGRAVADVLVGNVNPSGKLTATWPRSTGQIPMYYARKNTGRPPEGSGVWQFGVPFRATYIDEDSSPLFPFGFGLSYTAFAYSGLVVELPDGKEGELVIRATVTNGGGRAGDEIVQLYVRDLVAAVTRPVKELKGFQRVALEPGEQREVQFTLPIAELGFHGPDLRFMVEPGRFQVWVGPNSQSGLKAEFTLP